MAFNIRLFADDCVLYGVTDCPNDCDVLQKDLNRIVELRRKWGMCINLQKSPCMRVTKKREPRGINETQLSSVPEYEYLGAFIAYALSWRRHVDYVTVKSCRVLGFLSRNTKQFSSEVRVAF